MIEKQKNKTKEPLQNRIAVLLPAIYGFFYIFVTQNMYITNNTLAIAELNGTFFICAFAIMIIVLRKNPEYIKFDKGDKTLLFIILALGGYILISFLWSPAGFGGVASIYSIGIGMILSITQLIAIRDKKDFDLLIHALTIYLVVLSVIGIAEAFTGKYFFSHRAYMSFELNDLHLYHSSAGFFNNNNLGLVLTSLLPFMVYDFLLGKASNHKKLMIPALLIVLFTIVNTTSRFAYIALIIYVLAGLVALFIYGKSRFAKIILIVIFFFAILTITLFNDTVFAFISNTFLSIFDVTGQTSTSKRIDLINTSFDLWKGHFFGVGAGASPAMIADALEYVEPIPSHMMNLTLLTEYGLVGLIGGILPFIIPIVRFAKIAIYDKTKRFVSLIFVISIIGFLVVCNTSSDANTIFVTWMLPGTYFVASRIFKLDDELLPEGKGKFAKFKDDLSGKIKGISAKKKKA